MKLLVLGASGLVGSHLYSEAKKGGHEVTGTYRFQKSDDLVYYDSADFEGFTSLLYRTNPDVVVDCCSWTWVDGCEKAPERAALENSLQPAARAKAASIHRIKYVYLSTSYVFDGNEKVYDEYALPNPINVYGSSKLDGEHRIQNETGGQALIARTMGVYGNELSRKNFLYQVVDSLRKGKALDVPNDQFGNFTWAGDLSEGIMGLVEAGQTGIWNIASLDPFACRSEIARNIARHYGLDETLIVDIPTREMRQSARRPLHAGLAIDKISTFLEFFPKHLGEIQNTKSWI